MGYPIVVDIEDKRVVIVGGGAVAARRAGRLVDERADVAVISPRACDDLADLIEAGGVDWRARGFEQADLAGAALVIAATDDPQVNRRVVVEARRLGVLVNAVDADSGRDFSVPAVAGFGRLQVAIDTGGAGPALSGALRRHLEATLSPGWARGAEILGRLRPLVAQTDDMAARRAFWAALAAELPGAAAGGRAELIGWLRRAAAGGDINLDGADLERVVDRVVSDPSSPPDPG